MFLEDEDSESRELRDDEEVECDTPPGSDLFRNGLSDDSYNLWTEKKIPYVIRDGFNETSIQNIMVSKL